MTSRRILYTVLLLFVAIVYVHSYPHQIDKGRLRFKISGRNLEDKDDGLGTSDGYVEVFVTEGFGTKENKIGRSDTISNSESPDWAKIFEFDFDRSKDQQLHFMVWDEDDLRTDDKVGRGWLNANDFVDRGQLANVPLYKKGYLTVQSVEGNRPSAPRVWPETQKLVFQLSAQNLPDKDDLGTIDPYAEIFQVEGITGKEVKVGRTGTLTDQRSPNWGDRFDFQYNANKNQRLVIKVWDHDNLREDDKGGIAYVDIEDYVRRGQTITVNMSKRGRLTVMRADGLPAVPPTAPTTTTTTTTTTTVRPGTTQSSSRVSQVPPVQSGGQGTSKLQFRLSAYGLDDKDILGTSDPYVKVYYIDSSTPEKLLGNTEKLQDTESPTWTTVFNFTYDSGKNPKLKFLVLDEDDGRRDDELGQITVDVAEYIQKNQDLSVQLPKGTLNIRRA